MEFTVRLLLTLTEPLSITKRSSLLHFHLNSFQCIHLISLDSQLVTPNHSHIYKTNSLSVDSTKS
jgi:hypothetical protein